MHVRQSLCLVLFVVVRPAYGIVIQSLGTGIIPGADYNASDYLAPFNTVLPNGLNLNGVVVVSSGSTLCSGALISSTQVLTAAHCFNGSTPSVSFVDSTNSFASIVASSYVIDPDYLGSFTTGADLAIVTLSTAAPSYATVYPLFNGTYTMGSTVTIAGFGTTGTGDAGETSFDHLRRVGENSYDQDGTWLGYSSNLLIGDFDNGQDAQNSIPGSSLGLIDEVDIGHGDSGGPSFYNGQIIGIHDIIECFSLIPTGPCQSPPSVFASTQPNSYYGELFGDTSVKGNAAWIDGQLAPEPAPWLLCLCGLTAFACLHHHSLRRNRF